MSEKKLWNKNFRKNNWDKSFGKKGTKNLENKLWDKNVGKKI